jgi:hypothetical protein
MVLVVGARVSQTDDGFMESIVRYIFEDWKHDNDLTGLHEVFKRSLLLQDAFKLVTILQPHWNAPRMLCCSLYAY